MEMKGFAKAMSALGCKEAEIITAEESGETEINGIKVQVIPLWKWLLKEDIPV